MVMDPFLKPTLQHAITVWKNNTKTPNFVLSNLHHPLDTQSLSQEKENNSTIGFG